MLYLNRINTKKVSQYKILIQLYIPQLTPPMRKTSSSLTPVTIRIVSYIHSSLLLSFLPKYTISPKQIQINLKGTNKYSYVENIKN